MDDDKTLKMAFPLGSTGPDIIVSRPSEGQMLVLMMSKIPTDDDQQGKTKLVQRLFRVMESVVGTDQWENVIEQGLLSQKITAGDLMDLVHDILGFDWTLGKAEETVPVNPSFTTGGPQPGSGPSVQPESAASQRGPRIVSGG